MSFDARFSSYCLLSLLATVALRPVSATEPLPPITRAAYDGAGRFVVNGTPFFPVLLYGAPLDEATLAELRDFGFNVLTCRPEEATGMRKRGFYAAVHRGKSPLPETTSVLLAMGIDSPALNFKQDLLARTAEYNAKVRAAIPDRPLLNAVGYWEDEPAGVVAGKLPTDANYEDLIAAIDVAAPYLYPVPYQPVATVGDAVARARAATDGTKPVLPILQLFAWTSEARYPTPAELRAMVFLALVEGAHGIGYYSFGHVTGKPQTTIAAAEPELWRSVKSLNRDVAVVGPRLLAGKSSSELALADGNASLRLRVIRDAAGLLAVVVNPTPDSQTLRLRRTTVDRAGPLGRGDRELEFHDDAATLSLDPFETAVLHALPRK